MLQLLVILPLVGCLGGFLSGLLGVGGGIIYVPALFFALRAAGAGSAHLMHVVVASSLAIVLATTLVSSRAHHRRDAVDMGVVKSWGPFLALGVVSGSVFAGSVDAGTLKAFFAAITGLVALYMAFGRETLPGTRPAFLTANVQKAVCCIAGGGSAMAGMGGAVLTVPLLVMSGHPMQRAVGTSTALAVIIAVLGMSGYILMGWAHRAELMPFSLGFVNPAVAALVMAGSLPVAPLGVRVSHRMDKKLLRRIFAAVLACVSAKMYFSI